MSHDYHSEWTPGTPLSAIAMERRFSEFDAALATAMTSGSGWQTTLDGTATAGQKVVPVTTTVGAVAGALVYLRNATGTTLEERVIDTIQAGVSVTLTANLTNTFVAGAIISASPAELAAARGRQSSLNGRLLMLSLGIINVRDYGAKGDGVTDDLAALNAAVAALGTATVNGVTGQMGYIFVPDGSYKIGDTWSIDVESIHVEMSPGAVIWTAASTSVGGVVNFSGYPGSSPATVPQRLWASIHGGAVYDTWGNQVNNAIGFARYKNARVENVRIPTIGRKGITAQYGVDQVHFVNNTIGTAGLNGITVESTCNFVLIEGNTIDAATADVGINVTVSCTDVHIERNTVRNAGTTGISSGGNSSRLWIRDNTVAICATGIAVISATSVVVAGNDISWVTGHALVVQTVDGRCAIVDNLISTSSMVGGTKDAINLSSMTVRADFRGNTITGAGHRYCINVATSSGYNPISQGNTMVAGLTGIYGGYVPYLVDDVVDGIARRGSGGYFRAETFGTTAPAAGTWSRSDHCTNTQPSAAGAPGWTCTAGGTPGTWKADAVLAA